MKTIIVSICFITHMVMCGGLAAQNNETKTERSTENALYQTDHDSINKWDNPFEPFVGVWSLERNTEVAKDRFNKIYPGTFMIVHADAAYTIFVNTDVGAVITSQGNILIESPDVLVEVISRHVNNSMVGISNRVEYKIDFDYLYKTFWVEKDRKGGDYKREVNETWKRAKMPVEGDYEDNIGFPI